ncbi:hypothetical protein LTR98_011480 [Exophiala xenobiotica]|nr:hypothetical protein LTR98_011480 [Exophiala xenobiotica]
MPSSSASPSPSPSSIPSFYRIFFSTFDPLIALTGVLVNIFAPSVILKLYDPNATLPPSIETTVLIVLCRVPPVHHVPADRTLAPET